MTKSTGRLKDGHKLILLIAITVLVFTTGLSVGSTMISPLESIGFLLGGGSENAFVLGTLRLPRLLLSMLAGAALGVAGLILQGMVRNPLASPDVIGITGGAKVAAVAYLTFFASLSVKWLPLVAIAGAGVSAAVIYALAWRKGVAPIRLVLVGIGVEAAMGAVVTMLIVLSPTYSTSDAYIWMTGSVYGANWKHVVGLAPWVLLLIPLAVALSRQLSLLELGDDLATGLGLHVQRSRLLLTTCCVALAGAAIAFAGGIGFVGLIAPHITKKTLGRTYGFLIPGAAATGAMIVMGADIVARTLFLPLDLPAGVFVSGIGAPFFIYLLYRNRNLT